MDPYVVFIQSSAAVKIIITARRRTAGDIYYWFWISVIEGEAVKYVGWTPTASPITFFVDPAELWKGE